MKIRLSTGREISLAAFGHEHLVTTTGTIEEFRQLHDYLLEDGALDEATVTDGDDTIAVIHGMELAGTQTVANTDGTVTGHFYTRGGTYDLDTGDYAQAGRILLGEG